MQQLHLGFAWTYSVTSDLKTQVMKLFLEEFTLLHIEGELVLDHTPKKLLQITQVIVPSLTGCQYVIHVSDAVGELIGKGIGKAPEGVD